jgi:hypothetical protein
VRHIEAETLGIILQSQTLCDIFASYKAEIDSF